MKRALILIVALWCAACTPGQRATAASMLQGVAQGADWLAAAIDAAESGSERYFARHPNRDAQQSVSSALHRARLANEALTGLLATVDAINDERLDYARKRALKTYASLYALLDSLGVQDAIAPAGGADGDAPDPLPFALPSPDELASVL